MLTGDHTEAIHIINRRIAEIAAVRSSVAAYRTEKSINLEANNTLWELDARIDRLKETKKTLTSLQQWGAIHRVNGTNRNNKAKNKRDRPS